jgi:hypothetical protein
MREGIMYVVAWCTLGVYSLLFSFPFTFRISSKPYVIFRIFYIDISVNDYLIVESDHRTESIIHIYLLLLDKAGRFLFILPPLKSSGTLDIHRSCFSPVWMAGEQRFRLILGPF